MAFEFTDLNFKAETSEGVVLVDFWATWCGPCRAIAPIIQDLSNDYSDRALVGKLDVDNNPQVATNYNIRSIPTILILKDGKVFYQHVGLTTRQVLEEQLKNALTHKVEA